MIAAVQTNTEIEEAYKSFIGKKEFACVAARAALAGERVQCMVAGHMACPKDDKAILNFLYSFVDAYRSSAESFHSAAIIFEGPQIHNEEMFDALMWQRLQALSDLDAQHYSYDNRVAADPSSANFSFSLKGEAFFIIGLHPGSSRATRRFAYPALAFNPHAEFEKLRLAGRYDKLKEVVRKRDAAYSGSVNPMLRDHGEASEVYQYSGRKYEADWQCPLQIHHARTNYNSAP